MVSISLNRLCEEYFVHAETNQAPEGDIPLTSTPNTNRTSPNKEKDKPLDLAIGSLDTFNGIRRGNLAREQRSALDKMKIWFTAHEGPDIANLPIGQVHKFIQNFCRVFFLADLSPDILDFQYVRFSDAEIEYKYGHSRHFNGHQEIRVDNRDWSREKLVDDHKTALLGTTFHECIHAYFCAFCCDNPDHLERASAQRSRCRLGDEEWYEGFGHFTAWFHLAAGVDIALGKFQDWGTDLAVFRSLLAEYRHPDGARICAEEWKRFFNCFAWKDIDGLVRRLTETEFHDLGYWLSMHTDVVNVIVIVYRREKESLKALNDANRAAADGMRSDRQAWKKV